MSTTLRVIACVVFAAGFSSPSAAQYIGGGAPPPPVAPVAGYAESPGAALARHVRTLAGSPRNYEALIGAGKAALATGDPEAAIGFYGRAEEVNPRSWVPKIGQGAALVQMMDAGAALAAFEQAQRLGASQSAVALERGLAFDLVGDQLKAQNDYRIALSGVDPNEARRRLALSLAVSNKRAEALSTLDPLLSRRDPGAIRARAFVLACTGDAAGARSAVNAALPGMAATMEPFLRRLATLRPAEKVAAVHFGVMPGNGSPSPAYQVADSAPQGNRLGEIDQLLRTPPAAPPAMAANPASQNTGPVRVAVATPTPRQSVTRAPAIAGPSPKRLWLQLASGNAASLPAQFRRLSSKEASLFEGISGYVVEEPGKARLVIGPFKSKGDADTFAEDLASVNIDSFAWTSQPGQQVRKLSAQ